MRVGVTGATGFIGRRLCETLAGRGAEVIAYSRDPARAASVLPPGVRPVGWNPAAGLAPPGAVEGLDAVVNLAGESIGAPRWSTERKRRIRDSRVLGTRHLVESLAALAERPRVLVSQSGVDYYGSRGDEVLDESAPPGRGFLAEVCQDWEAAATLAEGSGVRVVRLRSGLVLGPGGGFLAPLMLPFKLGLGASFGSGRQWLSWIHIEDEVGLILHAIDHDELSGPVNAVAPGAVTNAEFARALAAALGRPAWLRVPEPLVRLAMGEAADLLLSGRRVYPARALATGYRFRYPELGPALRAIVSEESSGNLAGTGSPR